MRQKLGALLCVALGGVLIFSALDSSATGAVGEVAPTCGEIVVGVANPGNCPTGTITLTEHTDRTANPGATAPAGGWEVTVSGFGDNPCNLPTTGTTQHVADGGSVNFDNLYIFQNQTNDTYCQYQITETPVEGFTASYDPTAPYSFIYVAPTTLPPAVAGKPAAKPAAQPRTAQGASPLPVTLTNTAAAAPSTSVTTTPSSTPPTTKTTTPSSASVSPTTASTTVIVCGNAVRGQYKANRCPGPSTSSSNSAAPVAASSSAALANTGPSRPVKPSLFIGAALVLLGGVLLIAGRRRPRGEHA